MTESIPEWWQQPRNVVVMIDNDEWMLSYCEQLVEAINTAGDNARLCDSYTDIPIGDIAFFLSCHRIAPPDILARNRHNLAIHASNLPAGRGWSPLTWQILAGENRIPLCLFEATEEVDAGPVYYREYLEFRGDELIDEMRVCLAEKSIELCQRFLSAPTPPVGTLQAGEPAYWARRRPEDSRLDPDKTLAEQFNLLRTVDNQHYPAFFELHGKRYYLKISKAR